MEKATVTPTNLGFTYQELEAAGIKAGLHPVDLVELISEHRYNSIIHKLHLLEESAGNIAALDHRIRLQYKDVAIDELQKRKLLSQEQVSDIECRTAYLTGSFTTDAPNLFGMVTLDTILPKPRLKLESSVFKPLSETAQIEVSVFLHTQNNHSAVVGGIQSRSEVIQSHVFNMVLKISTMTKRNFNKELAQHTAAVREFYLAYKDKIISLEDITRETRVQFNSTLLNTADPKLYGQLSQSFGLP